MTFKAYIENYTAGAQLRACTEDATWVASGWYDEYNSLYLGVVMTALNFLARTESFEGD